MACRGMLFLAQLLAVNQQLTLQTHHVYSTLQWRGNGLFHVVSSWNARGVYLETLNICLILLRICFDNYRFNCTKSSGTFKFHTYCSIVVQVLVLIRFFSSLFRTFIFLLCFTFLIASASRIFLSLHSLSLALVFGWIQLNCPWHVKVYFVAPELPCKAILLVFYDLLI